MKTTGYRCIVLVDVKSDIHPTRHSRTWHFAGAPYASGPRRIAGYRCSVLVDVKSDIHPT
ncbi:conserved protein of unknown function [Ectopseudomonas oleovorans]|uniref:Uncharacterized protein n=1 Tax=Ectopseudomonas oleovorans TaxID=301 RepID=A0A653AYA8_ECTOL|nr:conserved protein of unknown function [Pseudomonas oleovorans]